MNKTQYEMLKKVNEDNWYDRTDADEETKEVLLYLQSLSYVTTKARRINKEDRVFSCITQTGKSALEQYKTKQKNNRISKNSYRISVIAIIVSICSLLLNVIISLKSEIATLFQWLAGLF